ncbi:hypothetical protein K4L04_01325 [Phaeobacter inhibens]|uniref:hypothetical protein n=1 Tax=Phaeobacter inhibens TaxID=221822 RepID=UPI0021A8E031|nr:hypothetical protein [Phaeobacter inhibens]UWR76630.1 hypothetical protein K4L04_01325 [Phaeobacter inhibens]
MSWPVSQRRDQHNRVLMWVEAKEHLTGDPKPLGIWDGRDHQKFEIDGEIRAFFGAGNIQQLKAFTSEAGLVIQNYGLDLAAFSPEVRALVRARDVRFARVQIYVVVFDPETGAQLGLHRVFSGVIDGAPEEIGAAGGDALVKLNLVSNARLLTRKAPVLKSQAAQSKREDDKFFQYADVSGSVPVFWGRWRHRD